MPIATPLSADERLARVRENILAFNGPRLKHVAGLIRGRVAICGYGPSLADTWREISGRVITTSGAHDFMISRGIVPHYHVETDPREYKAKFVGTGHPDVTYLINAQCHPTMFNNLAGRNVVMWHGFTDDDAERQIALVESMEPGTRLLAGGTNVGMRAIVVARELGFNSFELHGMDCCYRGATQWAGDHLGHRHGTVLIDVEGEQFETSDLMLQSTDDFFNAMRMMPGCRFRVHGGGLLEARLKLFLRDPQKALNPGWWQPVNFTLRKAAGGN